MKKMFLTIMAVGLALTASAQQTEKQMATLQHGEQTKVYYGPNAFVSAYNAAADTLDVITLSSGEFNVPSQISKSIAVYGSGFVTDATSNIEMTRLRGNLVLVPADAKDEDGYVVKAAKRVNGIHLEGLKINDIIQVKSNNNEPIHNLEVVKCAIDYVEFLVDCYDCVIRQSRLPAWHGGKKAHNLLITNCYVGDSWADITFDESSTILFDHCILYRGVSSTFRYTNNIMMTWTANNKASYSGNVFVGTGNPTQDEYGNWRGVTNEALWAAEGENGEYAASKDFALKYPERYVGTDGTEIGLHGGVYAWNKAPCIPRITECTLDTKDAANGTIRVSIQAEAQTKE